MGDVMRMVLGISGRMSWLRAMVEKKKKTKRHTTCLMMMGTRCRMTIIDRRMVVVGGQVRQMIGAVSTTVADGECWIIYAGLIVTCSCLPRLFRESFF